LTGNSIVFALFLNREQESTKCATALHKKTTYVPQESTKRATARHK
jgi:hypothetical protein